MNWLQEIVNQHHELESPRSFWYWSAIAALSAVVKDNVWINRQIYNLYPNIYVMLHAESGMKKGPPVSMAKKLVKQVNNTRIISGRSSIQGILKELGTAHTVPGGGIKGLKSVAFICSSELSSSIVEDKVATKLLTDLYDRQYNDGEWKSLLKMESFELKDPTVTMLTATNEAMSEDFFTRSAMQGGYFARTFIVYEKESIVSNSLIYPLFNAPDYTVSSCYLKEISKLTGQFEPLATIEETPEFRYKKRRHGREIYFNECGLIYDDWYDNFKEMIKTSEKDETGTLNRFGDSVLKVAMLLSLARSPTLILSVEAMEEAIVECEKLLGNVRKTTMGKHGVSPSANIKTMIIMELLNRETHQISRTVLMKKMWSHYNSSEELDEIMQSFDAAGIIITTSVGNQILYTMPDKQVEELKEYMKGKMKK